MSRFPRTRNEWISYIMLTGMIFIFGALVKGDWRIMLTGFLLMVLSILLIVLHKRKTYRPSPKDESDVYTALNDDPRFNNSEP